jgi:hypothetical protein
VVGMKDAALEQKNETVEISTGGQATKKSHFRNLEKYFLQMRNWYNNGTFAQEIFWIFYT